MDIIRNNKFYKINSVYELLKTGISSFIQIFFSLLMKY